MKSFYLLVLLAFMTGEAVSQAIYPCPVFGLNRLPHSTECDKYIQCFAGAAVVKNCGPGLQFSESLKECTIPSQSECYRSECPLFNDPDHMVYVPDLLECGKYYLCHNGEEVPYYCSEGLHWDTTNNWCTSPALAECQLYEIECPSEGVTMVPNPFNCQRFYHCTDGKSTPNICPDGLLFDITINQCNDADDAVCYPGSVIPF